MVSDVNVQNFEKQKSYDLIWDWCWCMRIWNKKKNEISIRKSKISHLGLTFFNWHVIIKSLCDWLNQLFVSGQKKVVLQMRHEIYFDLK